MELLRAFLVGGMICVIGQLLLSLTKLTPARILVGFVISGVILTALGFYEPLIEFGGAGASVPLTGFGYTLAKGVEKAVAEKGWLGIFTGGFTAAAAGIAAAIFFGYLFALLCRPKVRK
ncbi:MAG: stage V sporulation protein AE [Clostridia bacterium]|nr:stage V sporulation protein AE [Clostridia bacterium]